MSKFNEYKATGFPILAPPQQLLVKPSGTKYAPSPFAEAIKAHGFDILSPGRSSARATSRAAAAGTTVSADLQEPAYKNPRLVLWSASKNGLG